MSALTEEQAYQKLASLCAVSEQCISDIRRKMQRWVIIGDAETIIGRLIKERFIDEHRFARAFALDKFRYNHWGREMIRMEMRRRNISSADIDYGISEIPQEEYESVLRHLIEAKRPTVKGKSEYEVNQKIMRYALGKGFTMDEILRYID
ncbi:MAG: RecX family transcriptional regulator [Bacteroidaceae bacterium]|nr:RecX family transcriptional regulator [Bacteroidaceae bacterium]